MPLHHAVGAPPPPPPQGAWAPSRQILAMNEAVWMQIGSLSEILGNVEDALFAYEQAIRASPGSTQAMNSISAILRTREDFPKAIEYLNQILKLDAANGEAWGSLGHCYLMMDDLQQAYAAYQNALINLRNPKVGKHQSAGFVDRRLTPDSQEPKLWYGIGILYDRYGSLDHAEEAFSQVMQMEPGFEKANEIYFRLGIIYKQQQKYGQSLECFKYIVNSPPPPLTEEDIWFQIGHVHEQQKDFDSAKNAYQRVLDRDPNHAKVLQQLGWLHHQQSNSFASQEKAIEFLEKSVAADNSDAQSWYLLGRCYMSQQKYPKAYEAYQQAVYRDGRNPTFWCSIGVLYYQINQYRDALDAYSRAIRLNPFISEVWYDLGTLYESCNNQINDALDAYQRAAELDPSNPHIKARLQLLRNGQTNGAGAAPMPTDVHPQAYQHQGAIGPPGPQWSNSGPGPQQTQPPPGPPPGPAGNWARLSEVNPPPQPPNPYEQRGEPLRGPAPPSFPRQPSPRQEQQMRQYQDPARQGGPAGPGGPMMRARTPPPLHYPPPPPPQQQPLPPTSSQPPPRVANPNYSGPSPASASAGPPPPPTNGVNGPPPGPTPLMAYRNNSPRPELRPMHDNRMPSPKSAYPQHQPPYPQQDPAGPSNMESGAPPPQSAAAAAAEAALHRNEHDNRPPSVGPKRLREWEDETASKKPRPSTPARAESYRRESSEHRRVEEPRPHAYHPSEAAHHAPTHNMPGQLPPMQGPPPPPQNHEPERAARKMDIDEEYDDDGEDDKKAVHTASGPGSTAGDLKNNTSPTGLMQNGGPKTE
ncbi:hypothetical protein J7T55_006315 [Diaporthe amygdali]|uniref:uncharacterized protein n=1 Tax=Phomopsis amygdali TaxID=1214568 RepID=UPI0022FE1279|nr:uncharacterized protein J7T55_006315 [Diaporthe amygdali]KAJ0124972.1 hypothetical protein J7T55_006315 [Diaporthe amygdali]